MDPITILSIINLLAPLAAKGVAQISAERNVNPAQVIADSNALDDATLARAIAFQAQAHIDAGTAKQP